MVGIGKARKVKKTRKVSKAPLYILIVSVIVILSLLGIGLYHSLGTVSPSLIIMVAVVLVATIFFELIVKRDVYRGRDGNDPKARNGEPEDQNDEN